MKPSVLGLLLLSCALSASAPDQAELDHRIRSLTAKFEALQRQPDKAVPAENLDKARAQVRPQWAGRREFPRRA